MSHSPDSPGHAAEANHWANMAESTFVGGMIFLYVVHRYLGRWPFRLCVYPVVIYYWLTRRASRKASLQYLQRHHAFHGLQGRAPGALESLRHFFSFAEVILDKLLTYTGRYQMDGVRVSGHEPLLAHMAAGQGAVVVTSHTGCVELCQVMAQTRPELKLTILVHTRHAPRFNRLMKRLWSETRVQLLQVTEFDVGTAMMLAQRMKEGEILAIAGDRIPVGGGRTCRAHFLGYEAPFPIGPYVLAAVLKCPLYFLGCVREGASYRIDIQLLAAELTAPRRQREAALSTYAQRYAHALEALLRDAPTDWFNFFPFWDQGPAGCKPTPASDHSPAPHTLHP